MADRRFGGSKYWLLGAAWWLAIAGALGIAHWLWPRFADSSASVALIVLSAVVGGFAVVYFSRPK